MERFLKFSARALAVSATALAITGTVGTTVVAAKAEAKIVNVCGLMLATEKIPDQINQYERIRDLDLQAQTELKKFEPMEGIFVTKRDAGGKPTEGFIRVLSDNPKQKVQITGDFNNWGKDTPDITLQPDKDPRYVIATLPKLWHTMRYRLVLDGKQVIDPAALVQTSPEFNGKVYWNNDPYLNSAFWDIEGVGRHDFKNQPVDLRGKAMALTENDVLTLSQKWWFNGRHGPQFRGDTYKFIAQSGVIDELKSWGVNAIEFLPLTASVDGDKWSLRYLNYAPFAIDSRWGTPQEFAEMVDAFNGAGIAVILDLVPGHFTPHGNAGVRDIAPIGIHNFMKGDGRPLFAAETTEWGTYRYDFANPYVRKFLVDGILNFIKNYGISGIRIDNEGGISPLPGGRDFLYELHKAVKNASPSEYINDEGFGGDNYITRRTDWGGMGADTHNDGDFYQFVFENGQKRDEEINMAQLRAVLRRPRDWYENATLKYPVNHDEAANDRGQMSGAYPATRFAGGGWFYVEGKTRVFGAAAMLSGSFYLDMPQFRLLQEGTYYSNPAVNWDLMMSESQRHNRDFYADMTKYFTGQPAFAFHNTFDDIENHTDYDNKVMSLKRVDFQTGKDIYILLNFTSRSYPNGYRFGVDGEGHYRIVLDSDNNKYGGTSKLGMATKGDVWTENIGMQGKPRSFNLPYVAPYSITILEKN